MHTFQINVLIKFLVSSTCFEHHVFIIRKTICTCIFYGMFFIHLCKQSSRWEDVLSIAHKCMKNIPSACTNGLPDVEHVMFETCRRHQEFN